MLRVYPVRLEVAAEMVIGEDFLKVPFKLAEEISRLTVLLLTERDTVSAAKVLVGKRIRKRMEERATYIYIYIYIY